VDLKMVVKIKLFENLGLKNTGNYHQQTTYASEIRALNLQQTIPKLYGY
jgi:hypothetical protein